MQDIFGPPSVSEIFRREAASLLERHAPYQTLASRGDAIQVIALILAEANAGRTGQISKLAALVNGTAFATKKFNISLPALPDGLEWPAEKFKDAPERNKYNAIIRFLERVWLPIIETNLIHRGHIALVDPDASRAIENFLHNNGRPRILPAHVFIPPQRRTPRKPSIKPSPPKVDYT